MRLEKQQWIIASLSSGAASLVALLLAVATAHWLILTDYCSLKYEGLNRTMTYNYTLISNYGLWKFCMRDILSNTPSCLEIGFADMGVSNADKEEAWRSGSVALTTRVALPAIISATVFTVVGFFCSIIGNFKRDKRTLVAAVMYISSGFCLSFSVILFISRINDETSLQPNPNCTGISYQYGWSFYLIGVAFVMEEASAVVSIKMFLMQNSKKLDDMIQIIPGLEDKIGDTSRFANSELSPSQTMIW